MKERDRKVISDGGSRGQSDAMAGFEDKGAPNLEMRAVCRGWKSQGWIPHLSLQEEHSPADKLDFSPMIPISDF